MNSENPPPTPSNPTTPPATPGAHGAAAGGVPQQPPPPQQQQQPPPPRTAEPPPVTKPAGPAGGGISGAARESVGGEDLGGKRAAAEPGSAEEPFFTPSSDPLFDSAQLLTAEVGTRVDLPNFHEFLGLFTACGCAIVCGTDPETARWTASRLALNSGYSKCYHSTGTATTRWTFPDMIDRIARRPQPTCFVLSCFNLDEGNMVIDALKELSRTVSGSHPGRSGLVIYMRSARVAALLRDAAWPGNIPKLLLQENRPQASAVAPALDPARLLERLSHVGGGTLREVIAVEPETFLPRSLARLAVLFPDLPAASFETLLREVLKARAKPLLPAEGEKEKQGADYSAVEVWAAAKTAFERQAGLQRVSGSGSARISFATPELAQAAEGWAWQDPEAMFETFAALSPLNLLFDDESIAGDRELFDAYLSAAAQVARRASANFSTRWLRSLRAEYHTWVQRRTGDDLPAPEDIVQFLRALAQSKQRRMLWRHFSVRFGELARVLYGGGSRALVERFLDQLARQGVHGLAVGIVQELKIALGAERFQRLRKLIDEGTSQVREDVLDDLAREVCHEAGSAAAVWGALAGWLPAATAESKSPAQRVAIVLPAAVLDLLERRAKDAQAAGLALSAMLEAPLPAPAAQTTTPEAAPAAARTVGTLWQEILARGDFGILAAAATLDEKLCESLNESELSALGVARALYQLGQVLPDEQRERAYAVARAALAAARSPTRTLIKAWWQHFADVLSRQREAVPLRAEHAAQRESLLRNYRLCRELIRL